MHPEPPNLHAVRPADRLDARRLPADLHQLLPGVALLVQVPDVARRERLAQRDRDRVVDPLEPRRHVRDERHLDAQLAADLALVDVVRQAVRDDVVAEVLHVVLRRRLRARARVPADAEHRRLPAEELDERRDAQLRGRRVAPRVRDALRLRDVRARHQLGEAVRPLVVEAVVGREVHDDRVLRAAALLDGVDEGLAHAVGQRHDPAVDLAPLLHAADILGRKVLVHDVPLLIALQLLARELAR